MGTTFTKGASKADIIREIRSLAGAGMLQSSVVGSVLWTVEEYTQPEGGVRRIIGCYLLRASRGFGWGYKAMDESVGPSYYSCPLRFLTAQPVAWNEYSLGWREKVKAFHQAAQTRKVAIREVQPGDTLQLRPTCKPNTLTCMGVRTANGRVTRILGRDANGNTYRVPKTYIIGYSRPTISEQE
jgi:hypothetical protein